MEHSQVDSKTFSVRIVSIDYYMAPPIPGFDICYSSFHGGKVNEVPVVRIYGSTPAGQKTCLHVHGALPYMYVPCADISLQSDQEDVYTYKVSASLEKALKLKGSSGLTRQHVHGCSLVRARRFYGYHSSEELFVKIYLYYPQDVSRAANLLLAGAVLGKSLQPYESHIPFILQFLVDYNLYGMGHVHLLKMKFRLPMPDSSRNRLINNNQQTGADKDGACLGSTVWTSAMVSSDWMWQLPNDMDASSNHEAHCPKRQSTCELEGDAFVDEILNQQFKIYSSLSQTRLDVQMVQSLVPIWKEQQERTGICGDTIPLDPGKPLPEVVMRSLSAGLDFHKKFVEMCCEAETCGSLNSFEELRETDIIGSASPPASLCKYAKFHEEGTEANLRLSTVDEMQPSEIIGIQDIKVTDKEALNLLKWLATSQAAEDINSDDELIRETILSPLLPATTIDKVLEKANMDYESESQKECQDILDSIDDQCQFESSKRKLPFSSNFDHPVESSRNNMIPQVDGSADEEFSNSSADSAGISPSLNEKGESKRSSKYCILQNTRTNSDCKDNRNKLWGSLSFSTSHNNFDHASLHVAHTLERQSGESVGSVNLTGNERENNGIKNEDQGASDFEIHTLDNCSVRDLMRRKRYYRVEQPVCGSEIVKKLLFDGDEKLKIGEEKTELKMRNHDLVGRKLPLVVCSHTRPSFCELKKLHPTSSSNHPAISCGKKLKVDSTYVQTDKCQQTDVAAIGSVQSSSIENFGPGRDNCERECSQGSKSHEHFGQTKLCENAAGVNTASDIQAHQYPKFDEKKPNGFGETVGKEPFVNDMMGNHMELTFGRTASMAVKALNDVPASAGGSSEEMETWNKHVANNSPGSKGNKVLSVATYYQNDGSHLCLLKPKILPPTESSVQRWLLCGERDKMVQETDAKEKHLPKWNPRPCLMSKHAHDANSEMKTPFISGGQMNPIKTCLNDSQDTSQISGPDVKSRSTPLSQSGFCDPASIGRGQQLTLLSIEVLAESRGELLPDPRFDAINIVALGFQNDSDIAIDVLVLLHCKLELCQRNFGVLSGCKVMIFKDEKYLLKKFIEIVSSSDPDILMGWDIQGSSLGFLAERASHLGLGLLSSLSRTPFESSITLDCAEISDKDMSETAIPDISSADDVQESSIIEDEWGRTHASGVHVGGRIVLNVWRLIRGEVKLNLYSVEAVAEAVLRRKVPSIHNKVLTKWFSGGPGRARYRCVEYVTGRAKLNLEILSQLDMVNRTSELARIFGIDFFSVLSRGSQYRVESMFLRLAHTQNYLAISPGHQQVASQPAMECLPLVMEPESGFYSDPVVVFDFQSLYPSMIIAYNLCFCTCLGKVVASKANTLGVSSFSPERHVLLDLKDQILLSPNGVMFVPSKVRQGILPCLLEEILSTRIMVKQAMKKLDPSQQVLQRIFNARQLALKLISNVTYGYTAAGFSGRMPCAELADTIVQCGRCTLERAISFVNQHDKWNAKVIYGDTDSMFVLLKGRTIKECFQIGGEIASAVTAMNPSPITLKLEKVYQPCFLLTKKRYVGYSYESPDQVEPVFDAKGIETVRRDSCGAVAKIMEQSLRLFFENQDLSEVKGYLQRQWKRILSSKVSLQDFVFAKEVRLGSYSARTSSLPPAAIVATKAMRFDPRAEPRYAERVPYVVIHGEPGARLVDMVVDPLEVLTLDSPFRINDLYYINKQVIPALQRVFGLVGADLNQWFLEMPRPFREARVKHPIAPNSHRMRIDSYYLSKHCILCGALVQDSASICIQCSENGVAAATAVIGKTSKLEQEMQHLVAICDHCGGGERLLESDVKCTSISCSVFYERRKVQKELLAMNHFAAGEGLYPKCMIEWF